ncbi:PilW family protein [Niveibacterium sp. 24ML]|uniref:PilW family protein n=1 Tax=Niveibacterium sp. 24ML TaxID=2985512 RepID=UPI0022720FE2|nr:PilW family protein [Niveibacterium sp. 24ML]MCX9155067.1 PilW family protein [Niveibacterium sp. 24ML]
MNTSLSARLRRQQQGVSLIEVMVGVSLGIVASLVVTSVYSASESFRRNISGGADAMQTAALASVRIDMTVQEAGAGFVRASNLWGCKLNAKSGTTQRMPLTAAAPTPFSAIPINLRMVPVAVINGGSGSDVLLVFSGDSAGSNRDVLFDPAVESLVTSVSLAISPKDLLLVVPQDFTGDPGDCQIVQVANSFAPGAAVSDAGLGVKVAAVAPTTVPLDKTTYGDIAAAIKPTSPSALQLGAAPVFSAFALNSRGELLERDLLGRRGHQMVAENVFLFKVLLGVDNGNGGTPNDNIVDQWVSPATAGWSAAELMDGKASTQQKITQIKAVRLGLVTRSKRSGGSDVVKSEIKLFSDLGENAAYSRTLTTDERTYQYQQYEWIVPLRNMKAVPKG